MSDIIHLLPDSVANQIAAGEVIQRPASVIKELVENSLDAGATHIQINVKGAGRTSIQVIDNGKGMSETDARLSFERHATSKITQASDLFELHTMGFRGEALASIAAVAHVELKTRRESDELGTLLLISGSQVEQQEPCNCAQGTSILVRDLFYNVPARRKFLKSDETELRNIIQEIQRIVLINPHISFEFFSGQEVIYELSEGNFKQRITSIFGKKYRNLNQQLLRIEAQTNLVNIVGYVGKPESATKSSSQFFFVNNRYMNHPYFRKAVLVAYDRMIQPDTMPPFFIDIQVDPSTIDVNIHPTKTEIKFENEREIWSILSICVKEALGKFNVTPSIDFDTEGKVEMPITPGTPFQGDMPRISVDPNYNPFHPQTQSRPRSDNWQTLYQESLPKLSPDELPSDSTYTGLNDHNESSERGYTQQIVDRYYAPQQESEQPLFQHESSDLVFQYKKRYICTAVKSGLMLIDIKRARMRLFYDTLLQSLNQKQCMSQQLLFPEVIEFSADDHLLFTELELDLSALGFCYEPFGKYAYAINGVPAILPSGCDVQALIADLLLKFKEQGGSTQADFKVLIAQSISRYATNSAVIEVMKEEEMIHLIGELFASSNANLTPDGKKIVEIFDDAFINSRF